MILNKLIIFSLLKNYIIGKELVFPLGGKIGKNLGENLFENLKTSYLINDQVWENIHYWKVTRLSVLLSNVTSN